MSNMNVDLRDLVLAELRRINKGKFKGDICPDRDSVTIINYDISRLYPTRSTDKEDKLPEYIKPPEKENLETGLIIQGEVTGNALRQSPNGNNLIHPIMVSTTYHTNEPDSLTRLSKPSSQKIILRESDEIFISYEIKYGAENGTMTMNSQQVKLMPPYEAVSAIMGRAQQLRLNKTNRQ